MKQINLSEIKALLRLLGEYNLARAISQHGQHIRNCRDDRHSPSARAIELQSKRISKALQLIAEAGLPPCPRCNERPAVMRGLCFSCHEERISIAAKRKSSRHVAPLQSLDAAITTGKLKKLLGLARTRSHEAQRARYALGQLRMRSVAAPPYD